MKSSHPGPRGSRLVLAVIAVLATAQARARGDRQSPIPYPDGRYLKASYSRDRRAAVEVPKGVTDADRQRLLADAAAAEAQRELPVGFLAVLANTTRIGVGSEASRRKGGAYLSPKVFFLHRTTYQDIPLSHGSDVLVVLSTDGRLLLTRHRQIPTSVDSTTPRVPAEEAAAVARADAQRALSTSALHAEPAALEIRTDEDRRGRLAWTVVLRSDSPGDGLAVQYWVSAIDRRILAREPLVYSATGTVDAPVVQTPATAPVASALPHLTIAVGGIGAVQSDDDGQFVLPASAGGALEASLSGPSVVVHDESGPSLRATATVSSPTAPVTLSFVPRTVEELAQTSAYYWVDFASRFTAVLHAPGERWLDGVPANVNSPDLVCNSGWHLDRHALYFGARGSRGSDTCANAAYSDIVLHEYGHALDQSNGGILDGAYSEGFGDSVALLATRQPLVGRDFKGPGTRLRDATQLMTWPPTAPDPVDPHAAGIIYSGFVLDLVQALRAKYTEADAFGLAKQLVFAAAAANPASIPDAVLLSIFTDYDPDDLSACSPHFRELATAADLHTIPRLGDCTDTALFRTVYAVDGSGTGANGLAGYDLRDASDRAVALDYDADGRQDLVLYRAGTGVAWVVHSTAAGTFQAAYQAGAGGSSPAQGIAGYDLSSKRDQMVPLPDERRVWTGEVFLRRRDGLFLFRPGNGTAWVAASNGDGTFSATYSQADPGSGIGGYDLRSIFDRVVALDYDGAGRRDLLLYRSGKGRVSVVRSSDDGTSFTSVYASSDDGPGIAGFTLKGRGDRIASLDLDGDGKDDLLLYRPGSGAVTIARSNGDGTFAPVYVQAGGQAGGIGGFDLRSPDDRVVVFDYDGDGRDDIFLYRPGGGLAVVVRSNGDGTFAAVPQDPPGGAGFAGYDFASRDDRVLALRHDRHRTDLLFYRPGRGAVWLVRARADGAFRALYNMPDAPSAAAHGISGYDFLSVDDQALAFDFNGDGNDDLLLYRPGQGKAYVLESMGR